MLLNSQNVYLTQWLKTATNGNVVFDYRNDTQRTRFTCKVCSEGVTVLGYDALVMPQIVQDFVKLHSHAPQALHVRYCPYCPSRLSVGTVPGLEGVRYMCPAGCHPTGKGFLLAETMSTRYKFSYMGEPKTEVRTPTKTVRTGRRFR